MRGRRLFMIFSIILSAAFSFIFPRPFLCCWRLFKTLTPHCQCLANHSQVFSRHGVTRCRSHASHQDSFHPIFSSDNPKLFNDFVRRNEDLRIRLHLQYLTHEVNFPMYFINCICACYHTLICIIYTIKPTCFNVCCVLLVHRSFGTSLIWYNVRFVQRSFGTNFNSN